MARTPLRETDPPRVGSYQLLARLGAGGMGVVYLASGQDGRPVALKVLRPEMADDAEFRTRFSREVTALTRVRGVCTVRVLDADTTSARPFLVTEYAEGPSLAEYVDSRGPMDPQMLYGLATGLAEALTAIHAAGIVHRDLKPSNVLLTAGGPKVIDFGIAQMLDATAVTRAGMTVGSAGYMAPEQIMGRAGTAADIFSWAVTIAYAASGQSPFGTGTSEVILYRILHETPDIAAVPAALHAQVAAAIDKDPHARPTAPELLSQLTRTAALPSAGSGNPTQTVLAQTWHPAGPPPATPSWGAPPPDTRPPDTRPPDTRPPGCAAAGGHAPSGPAHPGPGGRHPARRRRRGPRLRPVREPVEQPQQRIRRREPQPDGARHLGCHEQLGGRVLACHQLEQYDQHHQPQPGRLVDPGVKLLGRRARPRRGQLLRHAADRDRLQRRRDERSDRPHLELVDGHRRDRHRHVGHRQLRAVLRGRLPG